MRRDEGGENVSRRPRNRRARNRLRGALSIIYPGRRGAFATERGQPARSDQAPTRLATRKPRTGPTRVQRKKVGKEKEKNADDGRTDRAAVPLNEGGSAPGSASDTTAAFTSPSASRAPDSASASAWDPKMRLSPLAAEAGGSGNGSGADSGLSGGGGGGGGSGSGGTGGWERGGATTHPGSRRSMPQQDTTTWRGQRIEGEGGGGGMGEAKLAEAGEAGANSEGGGNSASVSRGG